MGYLSSAEIELQEKREEFLYIQRSGIEKAKQLGREEGREEGKIEIAKNLLDILDNETISLKIGLSIKDIEELR